MQEENMTKEELVKQQEILQNLVNVAFHDGLVKAISKAQELNNPYILDLFHDVLVDKLRDELVRRGKLKA